MVCAGDWGAGRLRHLCERQRSLFWHVSLGCILLRLVGTRFGSSVGLSRGIRPESAQLADVVSVRMFGSEACRARAPPGEILSRSGSDLRGGDVYQRGVLLLFRFEIFGNPNSLG